MIWLLIAAYLGVILGFVSKEEGKLKCTGVNIIIHDSLDLQFINADEVRRLMQLNNTELTGRAISDINLQEIEMRMLSVGAIRTAEVYFTVRGKLVVEVYQRNPVVRIISRSGDSFYIDEEGYLMPVSRDFCSHVLVANGRISEECKKAKYIGEQGSGMDILRDIFEMADYIRNDDQC